MKHDLVRSLRGVCSITFTPIVTDSIGEDVSIPVESGARNGSTDRRIPLQTVFCIFVPEVECAIAAGGAEGPMNRVEGDGVDSVDVADVTVVGRVLTMTLETEIRTRILILHVLDSAAAFDTTNREASGVCEAADHPCLPLQRGLQGLVESGRVVEIDDVDIPVCRADDEELVLDIHCVDAFLTFHRRNRSCLSQIPIFDGLVPRTRYEERRRSISRVRNHMAASDRSVVLSHLDCSRRVRRKIQHARRFVCTGTNDLGSVLRGKKASTVRQSSSQLVWQVTYRRPTAI